jgi:hypothetical protein
LLVMLTAEAPRALSKSEVQDRLWPDTFVSEGSVARLVADLRAALGEHRREGRVRTVHGFGYAWAGPIGDEDRRAPGPATARCWLITAAGYAIRLQEGENVVGRDPSADLFVDLPGVSRRHARVVVTGASAIVEDLGSKNGTFVNDQLVSGPAPLAAGDRVRIGSLVAIFRAAGSDRPTETLTP